MPDAWGLPETDVEYRLALRLLNQDPPLDRQLLDALVGQPQRYSELRPLLDGRNDNVLSKALSRLRNDGLIQQGIQAAAKTRFYSLTELGKLVLYTMHEMIPHQQSIDAFHRGVRASA